MSRHSLLLVIAVLIASSGLVASQLGVFTHAQGKPDKAEPGVPVKVDVAERQAAQVYLDSIATVQAFNTVSVRARVDGQIDRVLFKEGADVKRGEVLVLLDKRPFEVQLRAALAQKAKDAAQLVNAKRNLDRYQQLMQHDSIAPQTLDATRANYEQLRATLDADQAQADQAQLQLDYATIRAPIDGRLGARLVDAGNVVHANDANGLVTVTQIQPVSVSFALPQSMLAPLRQQQGRRALAVRALGQDGRTVLEEGLLTLINSQVDVTTGTIRCKATFANRSEALWPGAFVSVRVMLEDLPDVVTVPTSAIQPGTRRPFVFIVAAGDVAQSKEIEAGPVSGVRTVVLAGLSGGERVIVEGQFQVEPGKRVTPARAGPSIASGRPAAQP